MNPTNTTHRPNHEGHPMPKPFRSKPTGTVVPIKPANGSQIVGASGAMRSSAPPRMPPAVQSTPRRMSASDLATRVAERDAYNTKVIAERMARERAAQGAERESTDRGSYRFLLAASAACAALIGGLAWLAVV